MIVAKSKRKAIKAKPKRKSPRKAEWDRRAKLRDQGIEILNRILSFRGFLSCSFEPKISDVEIVVCFADLRGFTTYCQSLQREMQDRKIQNFLRNYLKVFNEGLMNWYVEWRENAKADALLDEHEERTKYIVPTSYKNLGDGVMMVWEIPADLDMHRQGEIAFQILFMLDEIRDRFLFRFRNLTRSERDSYSDEVLKLDMGFGVARGHAWKLDFGDHVDYAGSVLNLAARLQDFARPGGLVAQYDVSPSYFQDTSKDKVGKLVEIAGIKGYEGNIKAWINGSVDQTNSAFTNRPMTHREKGPR